jgi:hypothetical protein
VVAACSSMELPGKGPRGPFGRPYNSALCRPWFLQENVEVLSSVVGVCGARRESSAGYATVWSMIFQHYGVFHWHCLGSAAAFAGNQIRRDGLNGVLICGVGVERADDATRVQRFTVDSGTLGNR